MKNGNSRHVYFVDDEPTVRQVIAETLEQCRFRVSCFASAGDCLEQLGSQECNLLITDLKMPEMDGLELMREIKRHNPWIPVLILTGYGDIPTAVEAIKAGAVDFIEKPLDKKSFVQKVKALLPENGKHKHVGKPLTHGEDRVLKLVIDGMSNKEIASLLNRSKRTIEVHRALVMRKLGVDNVIDLVKRSTAMGLVELHEGEELNEGVSDN
ncbi:response regulator transcription factor [Planctomycetota bacterium]